MYPYQRESFRFGILKEKCGILLDMGLGKTLVAINIMRYHIQNNKAKKVLVVCPNSVLYNWRNAILESSEYSCIILSDPVRENRNYKFKNTTARFNIINYESLFPALRDLDIVKKVKQKNKAGKEITKFLFNKNYEEIIKSLGFDSIIFDESSRYLKNHASDRSRSSVLFSDFAYYKLLLTGTLISNKPIDLYTQFRVMTEGRTLGRNFYRFRNMFFDKEGIYNNYKIKQNKIKTLNSIIYKHCIRKTREECLPDLPEVISNNIRIVYDDFNRNVYEGVKKKVIEKIDTELGKAKINITSIFTQLLRLQQITSGFIKDEDTKVNKKLKHTPKLDTLVEQLEIVLDNEESAVVWCRFLFSIDMVSQELKRRKIPYIVMSGEDNAKEKYTKWKKYQSSDIPIFIGQVESGGFGIELFKKDGDENKQQHMFFYENVWTLDVKEQAKARIVRNGQKSICVHTDIFIEDTIDEKIINAIKRNKTISDMIMKQGTSIL